MANEHIQPHDVAGGYAEVVRSPFGRRNGTAQYSEILLVQHLGRHLEQQLQEHPRRDQ